MGWLGVRDGLRNCGQMAAFREFVDLERELAAYLAAHLRADEQMLA
jgi:hypothetical protein